MGRPKRVEARIQQFQGFLRIPCLVFVRKEIKVISCNVPNQRDFPFHVVPSALVSVPTFRTPNSYTVNP